VASGLRLGMVATFLGGRQMAMAARAPRRMKGPKVILSPNDRSCT